MIAKREIWTYPNSIRVWVGKYRHSHNLLHWHSDCELLHVEKGSIDVFCGKKTHSLCVGDTLYVDSEQVHYMHAREPETVLIVIIFDYDILKPYVENVRLLSPRLNGTYPIPEVYCDVRDTLLRGEAFCGAEVAGKIISLMASIFRNEELTKRDSPDSTSQLFMRLLETVSEKCSDYSYSDAVSFMGMSEGYFSRYFKNTTGITFSQYLNYVRTEKAIGLINGSKQLPMTEIAYMCGFGTIRNFNRIFRGLTGYSPRALPRDFSLSEKFVYPSDIRFDPTLHDCELIESASARD